MPLPIIGAAVIMPLFYAALRWFLVANVVGFVVRVLVAFGLNIVLVTPAVESVAAIMTGQLSGMPATALAWITFLNFHKYVGLILSGYAVQQTANFILRINR